MRRTLYLVAIVMIGTVSAASAQARPVALDVRLDRAAANPRGVVDRVSGLVVRVSGLLDDPEWQDYLIKGYTIQLHWTVQLWKNQFLGGAQPKTEWDVEVQAVPELTEYVYNEPGNNDRRVFKTLDALRTLLGAERPLRGPMISQLSGGDWFYRVSVDITALTQEQVDRRANGGGADLGEWVRGIVSPGKKVTLGPVRVDFTAPKK